MALRRHGSSTGTEPKNTKAKEKDKDNYSGQSRPTDQTGRPAKYDGRIGTTALAPRKVSNRVQDTRYCVSGLT